MDNNNPNIITNVSADVENILYAAFYGGMAISMVMAVYTTDLVDRIKEDPDIFRQRIKQTTNRLERDLEQDASKISRRLHQQEDAQFVSDFGRILSDKVTDKVRILESTCDHYFHNQRITDRMPYRSLSLVALLLCDLTVSYMTRAAELIRKQGTIRSEDGRIFDVPASLLDLRPMRVQHTLLTLERLINPPVRGMEFPDINKDKQARYACDQLLNTLTDNKVIEDALREATKLKMGMANH